MRVLGIDPGVRGAAALVSCSASAQPQIEAIFDFQIRENQNTQQKTRSFLDIISLSQFLSSIDADAYYCERMRPAPLIGVVSAYSIGNTMGQLEALSALHNKDFNYVSPHIWKGALACPASKDAARLFAQNIFGDEYLKRKLDHNRAEAALIAWYGMRVKNTTL